MRDAVAMQLEPMIIRIPGRAGISTVRMTRPERQTQSPPETLSPAGYETGDLDHGGICRSIVHCSPIPGVKVTAEEHEIITHRDSQRGNQNGRLSPSGVDVGRDANTTVAALDRRS